MESKFGQKLTEEEAKAYIPNLHLELTQAAEIKRLRKVIDEKTPPLTNSRSTMKSVRHTTTVSRRTTK